MGLPAEKLPTSVYIRASQYDPTRTLTLRNRFVRDMNKRFLKLRSLIRRAIVDEDCFGLDNLSERTIRLHQTRGPRAFDFPRSGDKIAAFMLWLRRMVDEGILEVAMIPQLGTAIEQAWTNLYVNDSYERGVIRARQELIRAGYAVPPLEVTGGILASMSTPFHMDRVGLLFTRVYSELQGITAAMDSQISRVLAQGMIDGLGPRQIARNLIRTISGPAGDLGITDTLGRFIPAQRRAVILARTETIRSYAEATLQEYRNFGVLGVKVKAEFRTAGDSRVCPICASMQRRVYSLEQASGIIPVHPQCFLDSQTPVYTSTGWKPIGKVEIGDLVLTHKGRFKRVYGLPRTPQQKPEVVRFYIKGLRNKTLTMTANHQIMVSDGDSQHWKIAADCTVDDKVLLLANRCARCDSLTAYFKKYCSRTCLSLDITDRQRSNPEHRKNISQKARIQMFREYSNGSRERFAITEKANERTRELAASGLLALHKPEVIERNKSKTNLPHHREASSKRMKKSNPMSIPGVRERATNSLVENYRLNPDRRLNARMAKHRKSDKMTSIERKMAELLDTLGVGYIYQYPILRYDVDFAIPSLRIVIECDGEYWHKDKQTEQIRQQKIEQEGWFLLRYNDKKINQCIDEVQGELSRVLMNHLGQYEFISYPIEKIEKWKIAIPRKLYNLSVEGDESYLAKGIVVHNCRCIWLPLDVTDVGAQTR